MIYSAKIQVREIVETTFAELESELKAAVEKQNQTLGLHVPESLNSLRKGISEVSTKLREMVEELKTEKGLSTLITFNHETRSNI